MSCNGKISELFSSKELIVMYEGQMHVLFYPPVHWLGKSSDRNRRTDVPTSFCTIISKEPENTCIFTNFRLSRLITFLRPPYSCIFGVATCRRPILLKIILSFLINIWYISFTFLFFHKNWGRGQTLAPSTSWPLHVPRPGFKLGPSRIRNIFTSHHILTFIRLRKCQFSMFSA
jgi:hypothetical protein